MLQAKLYKASGEAIPKFQAKLSVSSLQSYEGLRAKLSYCSIEERSKLWCKSSSKPYAKLFLSQSFGSFLTTFWLYTHLSATYLLEVSTG